MLKSGIGLSEIRCLGARVLYQAQIKQCLLNGIKTFLHYRKANGFARFF